MRRENLTCLALALSIVLPAILTFTVIANNNEIRDDPMNEDRNHQFVENIGQWKDDLKMITSSSFGNIALGESSLIYDVKIGEGEGVVVGQSFPGSNMKTARGSGELGTAFNYIYGDNEEDWVFGARCFEGAVFEDLYDGIDLSMNIDQGSLKYEFHASPYSDVDGIRIRFQGQEDIHVLDSSIVLDLHGGATLVDEELIVYYADGEREDVDAKFQKEKDGSISIEFNDRDPSRPLVIDPVVYATYLGGTGWEQTKAIHIDQNSNVYILGFTESLDIPGTTGYYQQNNAGSVDACLYKMDRSGSNLLQATYIGGSGNDYMYDIEIDDNGYHYLVGHTLSTDFPTSEGCYQGTNSGERDMFILGLDANMSSLLFSTYIGGTGNDRGVGIDLSPDGDLTIAGNSWSSDFPTTTGAHDTDLGGVSDAVIMKMDTGGRLLKASTYLGGSANDLSGGMEVDSSGNIYVGGTTDSSDLTMAGSPYDNTLNGDTDAFAAVLKSDLSLMTSSTYFGGSGTDTGMDLDIDASGNVYITGETSSTSLSTSNGAFSSDLSGMTDIYAASFSSSLSSKLYCTYIGGSSNDEPYEIEVDMSGNAYISGATRSNDLPLKDELQDTHAGGVYDACGFIISMDGTELVFGTYWGGTSSFDYAYSVAVGPDGKGYLGGNSGSNDLAMTTGAYSTSNQGVEDHFLVCFSADVKLPPSSPLNLSLIMNDGGIELNWEEPSESGSTPLENYVVYRSEGSGFEVLKGNVPRNSYLDEDVEKGTVYDYYVTAQNSIGQSNPSNKVRTEWITVPSPPLGLDAAIHGSSVNLSWTEPIDYGGSDVQYYSINITSSTVAGIENRTTGSDNTWIKIDDLERGNVFQLTVSAMNIMGMSFPSSPVTADLRSVPDSPVMVNRSLVNGIVGFEWTAPDFDGGSPITSYKIYKGQFQGSEEFLKTVSPDTLQFTDDDVVCGKRYFYYVVAENSLGRSEPSNTMECTPVDVPGEPLNVEAEGMDSSILVSWAGPLENGGRSVTGYAVCIIDDKGKPSKRYDVEENINEFLVPDLENGLEYGIRVIAVNDVGDSIPSIAVYCKPMTTTSPPSQFSVETDGDSVKISWGMPVDEGGSPVSGFRLFRGTLPDRMQLLIELDPGFFAYEDKSIVAGRSYYYSAASVNDAGLSEATPVMEAVPLSLPLPPDDLTASSLDGAVLLTWSYPSFDGGSPVTGYRIHRSMDGGEMELLEELGSEEFSYKDQGLENGIQYHYTVSSVNVKGASSMSLPATSRPVGVPSVPMNVVSTISDGKVTITWTLPEDDGGSPILSYNIYLVDEEGDAVLIGTAEPSLLTFRTEAPEVSGKYYFSVQAVNVEGSSEQVLGSRITVKGEEIGGSGAGSIIGILILIILLIAIAAAAILLVKKRGPVVMEEEQDRTVSDDTMPVEGGDLK